MPCESQNSVTVTPPQSFSAKWFLDDRRVSSSQMVDNGHSVAAMTRWWSSSGFNRARCPKNLNRKDLTLSETGKQPVVLQTDSFVVCLVYEISMISITSYQSIHIIACMVLSFWTIAVQFSLTPHYKLYIATALPTLATSHSAHSLLLHCKTTFSKSLSFSIVIIVIK